MNSGSSSSALSHDCHKISHSCHFSSLYVRCFIQPYLTWVSKCPLKSVGISPHILNIGYRYFFLLRELIQSKTGQNPGGNNLLKPATFTFFINDGMICHLSTSSLCLLLNFTFPSSSSKWTFQREKCQLWPWLFHCLGWAGKPHLVRLRRVGIGEKDVIAV